ncbi:MAG: DUF11 domain-containing protein, partial [Actinobacteria bacterium]|nr:DUF11 domain-containing protein [Actinomycetota bacterium]
MVVTPKKPSITTEATSQIQIGDTIKDVAQLAGGTNPGGSITFKLYGPSDTTCTKTPVWTNTKTVSGNGTYTSDNFTPTQSGVYRWVAYYSGDGNNAAVHGTCGDTKEISEVIVAGINIDKTGPNYAHDGDNLVFTYAVTNLNSSKLTNIKVTDDKCSPVTGPVKTNSDADGYLENIGTDGVNPEVWTYTCTIPGGSVHGLEVGSQIVNTATVVGSPPCGPNVTDKDTHTTKIIHPAITVDKTASPTTIHAGDTVTYTILATNSGDTPLSDVSVTDNKCSPL